MIRRQNTERGSTMVEFAVAAMFLFSLIGFSVDIGVALYRYTLLTQFVADSAREISLVFAELSPTEYNQTGKCADIERSIVSNEHYGIDLEQLIYERFGSEGFSLSEPKIERSSNGSFYNVSITGSWPYNCYLCGFLQRQLELSVSADAIIEDGRFYCSP